MTEQNSNHVIYLLQRLLSIFDGILQALIAIKNDTAAILVGVNAIQGNTAAAVTALNNIINLINNSNTNLSNIANILNTISAELVVVINNLNTLSLQNTALYNQVLTLTSRVEELKVSQEAFYASILKYEDAVHNNGDAGVHILSVRQDTPQVTTSADLDYQSLKTDNIGNLYVNSYRNLPFNADYFQLSNPDINGNYQTITYKKGGALGTTVRTITLTYNTNGDVISYLES